MRTKGTTSFTEGKAGYFKIFIHGRSVENETGNLAVLPTYPILLLKYGVTQPADPGTVNPGTPGETGKPDAPKTGDTGNIIVWVLAASFTVAMIPVTVTLKRKSR